MTARLYYDDSYTTEFTARILERITVDDHPAVILDRTYFYPTGGGQPADTGWLGGIEVVDVFTREDDHAVIHELAEDIVGEIVTGRIDWPRRFDHMQQHTGQHMLTQAFVEAASANTVSFHLSPNSLTIDLDAANISPEIVDLVENRVNQVVQENRPVTARIVEPDEAQQLGARIRRIPGHLATGGLRVIEVEDFDLTACGGTHVARTGEIGLIKILKVDNYKGGSRVEFACGGRALSDYRQKHNVVTNLASSLTVGITEIPAAVERLRADFKAAQSDLKRARVALSEFEVPALLASADAHDGFYIICRVFEDRDAGDVRALASKLVQQPGIVALLGAAGDKAQIICARSTDVTFDMNRALQIALENLGDARGGGRPDFAQGGGVPATAAQIDAALAAASQRAIMGHTAEV